MTLIRPFRPLRPSIDSAAAVSAVPYDVVNRDEALALAQGNPLSFLRVSRPEIDLPPATDPYSSEVYKKAAENLAAITQTAPLEMDPQASLFIYELKFQGRSQTGLAATYSIDEYDRNLIKKHEKTRQDKEDDRTRHILSVQAQTGPVFLTYPGRNEINEIIKAEKQSAPLYSFTASDQVHHSIWRVSTSTQIEKLINLFKAVPALYIADGHHRAASASRARKDLASKNPNHNGNEDYNFFLAVAFPAEDLRILPYNRVLKDWNGQNPKSFLDKLDLNFIVTPDARPEPLAGEFSVYLEKHWYGLKLKKPIPTETPDIDCLDVSVLQNTVLAPLFGIMDPRKDSRIDFVGGIRGTKELERLVDSKYAVTAFSLHPTTVNDLMKIADSGGIMPPKSTWFEPKLRDGLLSHKISELKH